jgi:hypothetical protein
VSKDSRCSNSCRGIERIPPTLATIGKSIVEQTGWNTTILVGGPAPDEDGKIVTYL